MPKDKRRSVLNDMNALNLSDADAITGQPPQKGQLSLTNANKKSKEQRKRAM